MIHQRKQQVVTLIPTTATKAATQGLTAAAGARAPCCSRWLAAGVPDDR